MSCPSIYIYYLFQLADLTAVGPSHDEIWDYFLNNIIPVVARWQTEPTAQTSTDLTYSIGDSGVAATITPLVSGILDQLADADLNQVQSTIHLHFSYIQYTQVLQVLNPDVSNKDKSKSYVAVMFADLNLLGVDCQRNTIESVLRQSGLGIINDSRYFLKKDAPSVHPGQLLSKSLYRKVRCCSINKDVINDDVLDRLYQGIYIHKLINFLYTSSQLLEGRRRHLLMMRNPQQLT